MKLSESARPLHVKFYKLTPEFKNIKKWAKLSCFYTRAKCVIIWIAHFELRSVYTREVIAIFELCSVRARETEFGI